MIGGRFSYATKVTYSGDKNFVVTGKVIGYARKLSGTILCVIETETHEIFVCHQNGVDLAIAEAQIKPK